MNKTFQNLSLLLVILFFLVLGCGGSSSSHYSSGVKRGRLEYNSGSFWVNGREWKPENDATLTHRINWCDTSPNPKVEIIRCFSDASENYSFTYILRIKDDKPEVTKLEEGLGSVWVNDEGKWLLFRKFYFNVETSERKEVKGIPWSDDPNSSAPVQYVIAISPDMKTVVAVLDSVPTTETTFRSLKLRLIDTETGKIEDRKVNFSENTWLHDHENPHDDFQPPPSPSKKFVWEKGADGKDKIKVPALLENIELKDKKTK